VATEQHQMRSDRRVFFALGLPSLKKAAGVSGGKDKCQVRLKGRERNCWMGTEIGMPGSYGFQGQVTAGDGSEKQGKMEQGIII